VAWQVGGGGAVGVFNIATPGRIDNAPLFTGHTGAVLDLEWNPFNDSLLATVSEDGYGKVWKVPKGGLKETVSEAAQVLKGHKRKVGCLSWNGVAENVLATASQDYDVKVWDIASGQAKITVSGHAGIIQSLSWNHDGSRLVTYCKDKKMRVVDPRTSTIAGEVETHSGVKGGRALWMGKHDKIISVGFARSSERQYMIFDSRKIETPLVNPSTIDNSAGILMPFYDEDSEILFLAGKGDGNIRYYEIEPDSEPKSMVHFISQYTSNDSTAGCGSMAKRGCDVNTNEIIRLYKVAGTQVQPLSFKVPRKSDLFQDDIFPPCRSDEAALSAEEWFSGATVTGPKTKSLEGGFVQKEGGDVEFTPQEEEAEVNEKTLRKEHDEMKKRISYLEAEIAKRDARIKELEATS